MGEVVLPQKAAIFCVAPTWAAICQVSRGRSSQTLGFGQMKKEAN
jgi:hypothetical protein